MTSSLRGLVVLNGVAVGSSQSVLGHVLDVVEKGGSKKKWQRSICKEKKRRKRENKTNRKGKIYKFIVSMSGLTLMLHLMRIMGEKQYHAGLLKRFVMAANQ